MLKLVINLRGCDSSESRLELPKSPQRFFWVKFDVFGHGNVVPTEFFHAYDLQTICGQTKTDGSDNDYH